MTAGTLPQAEPNANPAETASPGHGRSSLRSTYLNNLGPTVVLVLVLGLAFGLRLYRLGDQSIWWDEGYAVWAARQGLAEAADITAHDVHPPLYLWMLSLWMRAVGESEFAVRYLSLVGGVLAVALTYVTARRLIGRRAALLATLLIATARFHIWWSQETRMYVWAAFACLLSTLSMLRLRHGRSRDWWLYVLTSAAALYTLYLSVLMLLVQNMFVALAGWRRPRRLRFLVSWGLAQLSVLALYSPWLYLALTQTRTDTAKTSFPFSQIWQLYGTVLATGSSTDLDRYLWLTLAFGLLAAAGIAILVLDRSQPQRYGFAGWEAGLLLLLPLVLPPLVLYALSIPRGIYYSPTPEARYLLVLAPLCYILLAQAITGLWRRARWGRIVAVCATALVLGTFVSVLPAHYGGRYLRDDYQTAMATLAAYVQPDDALLLVSGDRYPVFLYHYNRTFEPGTGPAVYLMPRSSTRFTEDNVDFELGALAEQHPRLWLASFERSLQDPEDLVEPWMNAHLASQLDVPQYHNYLRLYGRGETAPRLAALQPQVDLSDPIAGLLGYDLPTDEFRPGDTIRPALYLQPDAPDLVLRWRDGQDDVIAQQTLSVAGAARDDSVARVLVGLHVYAYTPPGQFQIEICSTEDQLRCQRIPVGRVTHSKRLPRGRPAVSAGGDVGNGAIRLVGCRLRPASTVHAGAALTVDLHWQAQQSLDTEYTVFVHLLGPFNPATGGPVWAQDDSYPLGGEHPTTRWRVGETVIDRHTLQLEADVPDGAYEVEVGLYDART